MHDKIFSRPWWRALLFSVLEKLIRKQAGAVPPLPKNPRRILVLAPVLRGDYIVLSPLMAGISKAYPKAELAVVVTKASIEIALADPVINRIIYYHKLPKWFSSVSEVYSYKPDIIVFPKAHPAFTETLLLLLSRAPFRIGLSHHSLDIFLTHPVPHQKEREHRTEAYARLLEPFGFDPALVNRKLHIGQNKESERKAFEFFSQHDPAQWVSLNVSAGSSARIWRYRSWSELIAKISETFTDIKFIVLGSPADRELCRKLSNEYKNVFSAKTGSFLDASAYVARTSVLISPDTGTIHAAAARNIPVVVLYNSDRINYTRFSPVSVPHRAIFAEKWKDVASIPVERVYDEFIHLLDEIKR
ncbi:glycosyltransferase family 9 protein [Calditrichota bacterium]